MRPNCIIKRFGGRGGKSSFIRSLLAVPAMVMWPSWLRRRANNYISTCIAEILGLIPSGTKKAKKIYYFSTIAAFLPISFFS